MLAHHLNSGTPPDGRVAVGGFPATVPVPRTSPNAYARRMAPILSGTMVTTGVPQDTSELPRS